MYVLTNAGQDLIVRYVTVTDLSLWKLTRRFLVKFPTKPAKFATDGQVAVYSELDRPQGKQELRGYPMEGKSSTPHDRIPLPVTSVFERMHISPSPAPVERLLEHTKLEQFTLQDFRPIDQSLEWQLSELAWNQLGVLPFAENEVPFIVTNSGRLSEHAAVLLFESCRSNPPTEAFCVVELGSGSGLFGRLLLDAFRKICEQKGTDYYQRLTYIATDFSTESVSHWQERGVFAEHEDRVQLRQCDAGRVGELATGLPGPVRAVFCNYVLDVLPSTVLQRVNGQLEELVVRTHLVADAEVLSQYTGLKHDEILTLVNSTDPNDRRKLLPLLSLLELETKFQPSRADEIPYVERVSGLWNFENRTVFNYGAMTCIEDCLAILEPCGFILINDYGHTDVTDQQPFSASQRFGPTLALGLNFPLLESIYHRKPWAVQVPDNDADAALHARLISLSDCSEIIDIFHNRFGGEADAYYQKPLAEARDHAMAGRKNEALEAYKLALSRNRCDWHVLGEIAEYVGLHLQDAEAGLEFAQESVRLNPCYSPWLWNVLGDCLFALDRFQDAHEAYLQAQRIDPNDPRTNFDMAFTYAEFREYEAALCAIARALAHDRAGSHREHVLEKQRQILCALSARTLGDHERLMRRTLAQR